MDSGFAPSARPGMIGTWNGRLRTLHAHPIEQAALDRAARRPVLPRLPARLRRRARRRGAHDRRAAGRTVAPCFERCALRRALGDARHRAVILIAYKFHQRMIDAVTGGREVTRQEEPRLYNILENLCISRGITMPTLKVIEDDSLNAFATGMNEKQYSITVTSGLLNSLNDAEIESVLGHELTHIRNGDVR